jgi:hypothetical protein
MTVNMDKSNIIVFKNGGNLSKNEKWYFKDELIKVVSYYKYLGVFFSSRLKTSSFIYIANNHGLKVQPCLTPKLHTKELVEPSFDFTSALT